MYCDVSITQLRNGEEMNSAKGLCGFTNYRIVMFSCNDNIGLPTDILVCLMHLIKMSFIDFCTHFMMTIMNTCLIYALIL